MLTEESNSMSSFRPWLPLGDLTAPRKVVQLISLRPAADQFCTLPQPTGVQG